MASIRRRVVVTSRKSVAGDPGAFICGPGNVSVLPSGHDAWVVEEENVVIIDFQGMREYAKKAA